MMTRNNWSSKLIHRIVFLENVANPEIESDSWQEKMAAFAEIRPITDNRFLAIEGVEFGHLITESYYAFTLRFILGLHINMRIFFAKRQFDIKRIINIDEKNIILKIIALEIS